MVDKISYGIVSYFVLRLTFVKSSFIDPDAGYRVD